MRRLPFRLDPSQARGRRVSSSRLRVEPLEGRQLLASFLVNTTADAGAGSLRQAILDANTATGTDIINFNLAAANPGPATISLTSPLPTITDGVLIDGTSETGFATGTRVVLDGTSAGAGANGLTVGLVSAGAPVTIQGLAIGHFSGSGIAVIGVGSNQIQGNFIGTNFSGTAATPNGVGISLLNSTANLLGGPAAANRNVISGNTTAGIQITGGASAGNVVQGNIIGLDATGATAVGNGVGVDIAGSGQNTVGGSTAAARNIISGNANPATVGDVTRIGVSIHDTGATANLIAGNYIGTNLAGTAAIGNGIGVEIATNATSNTIGGPTTASTNVISGNQAMNVQLVQTTNNTILSNYIGTTADGTLAIGGVQGTIAGVEINTGSTGNTVGGTVGGVDNLISGNAGAGVEIRGVTSGSTPTTANNLVQGNLIGTAIGGETTIPNGVGIILRDGTTGNTVGGLVANARNVISGNTGPGVSLTGTTTTGNLFQANLIGAGLDGISAVPNGGAGVLNDGALNTTIGGTATGAANTIAFNIGAGVAVNSGTGVNISRNSIYSNGGLGIDLAPTGVNPNIAVSPGVGPNNLLNYPTLTGVTTVNNVTTVTGRLQAVPSTNYSIELYANTAADASGYGQGRTFVGSVSVTTDSTGAAPFTTTTSTPIQANTPVSAIAVDGAGNTSEFAADVQGTNPIADVGLVLYGTPNPVGSGGLLTYTIGVVNGGPSTATNLVLTDVLPAGLTFQSSQTTAGNVSLSGQTVTANIGSLASGATATVTIIVTTSSVGTVTNTVTETHSQTDPNAGNSTASVITQVAPGSDLSVTATPSPSTGVVGSPETIVYIIRDLSATNDATYVNFQVPIPPGATYVSSTTSQGSAALSADGKTLLVPLGTVAANRSAQVTVTLLPTTAGVISTTATASSDNPDIFPANNAVTTAIAINATAAGVTTSGGPRVISLVRAGLHRQRAEITVKFDAPLSTSAAISLSNYRLVAAGRDGVFNTRDDVRIPLALASYDTPTNSVTLTTRGPLSFRQKLQLTVIGTAPSGVSNASGQFLDGAGTGSAGTNYVTVFRGVGPGTLVSGVSTAAVDSVLGHGLVSVKKIRAASLRNG